MAEFNPEQDFLKIYDELAESLWRHAYFRVSSKELAEDLVSETFLKAWDKYRANPVDNLKALLYRILHNLIIDYYRGNHHDISLDDMLVEPAAPHSTEVDVKIEVDMLRQHLDKMPEIYKQVLLWRYVDDLSIADIAELLGKTSGHVYVIIHRALKHLKDLVANKS